MYANNKEITVGNESNKFKNPNSLTFEERQKQLEEEHLREQLKKEQARKSPFTNFVQVNKDMYKEEDWLMRESPKAYRVFRFLVNNMNNYNSLMCSQRVIKEALGIGRTTVFRAIKLLKDKNFIEVYKSGSANIYCINKKLVWNSWGTNYKFAEFGSNIIISESEQEEDMKEKIKTKNQKKVDLKEGANNGK